VKSLWTRLCERVAAVTTLIVKLQPQARKQLLADVHMFKTEMSAFCASTRNGGLFKNDGTLSADLGDSLRRAEDEIDIRTRKKLAYCAGEELFSLVPSAYPELDALTEEVRLISKLHTLSRDVQGQLAAWGTMLWTEFCRASSVYDEMVAVMHAFSERCKQLPSELHSW
jgi:hypothetical protein